MEKTNNQEASPKHIIFDPSVLHYLVNCSIKEDNNYIVYIPDTLLKLIELSKEKEEYKIFLIKFLNYFGYKKHKMMNEKFKEFYNNIDKLNIIPITHSDIENGKDKIYQKIYDKFANRGRFDISMSPKINLLGDVIGKIITFSKMNNIVILSKTRRLYTLLREKISLLELPRNKKDIINMLNNMDKKIDGKSEFIDKLFHFPGGKIVKFFVGVVLDSVSCVSPILGLINLLFVFMDP